MTSLFFWTLALTSKRDTLVLSASIRAKSNIMVAVNFKSANFHNLFCPRVLLIKLDTCFYSVIRTATEPMLFALHCKIWYVYMYILYRVFDFLRKFVCI